MAVILPILVGFSRIVVGAHYPTDVLAGPALGVLSMLVVSALRRRIPNTALRYGILLAAAPRR